MVKVKAIIDFTYQNYNVIKNLNSYDKIEKGKIFANDIFEIKNVEALYLTGKNPFNLVAVKVLEVIPETIEKPKKRTTKIKGRK